MLMTLIAVLGDGKANWTKIEGGSSSHRKALCRRSIKCAPFPIAANMDSHPITTGLVTLG